MKPKKLNGKIHSYIVDRWCPTPEELKFSLLARKVEVVKGKAKTKQYARYFTRDELSCLSIDRLERLFQELLAWGSGIVLARVDKRRGVKGIYIEWPVKSLSGLEERYQEEAKKLNEKAKRFRKSECDPKRHQLWLGKSRGRPRKPKCEPARPGAENPLYSGV